MPTSDGWGAYPTERAIETALRPGRFISYGAVRSFIEGLEEVRGARRRRPVAGGRAVRGA
jgi:hypothetical protein